MRILLLCLIGFGLDLLFGDPVFCYHPIRLIGRLISFLERILLSAAGSGRRRQVLAGGILWILVTLISTALPGLLLHALGQVLWPAALILEAFWCYQLLALKSLKSESMKVYDRLVEQDYQGARTALSMIVGRDTAALEEEGIVRAAVETVAENTSDGVVAPFFYMLIGGAPLAFFYKAVNTMDSMIGYKNDRYRYFGRVAARADDLFNYLPARISALLMIAAAFATGMDGKRACLIYRRDKRNHASPNSAQTEAVCAGALGIRLGGAAYYFGRRHEKPTIGDPLYQAGPQAIKQACRLLYATAFLMVLLGGLLRFALVMICF